MVINSLEISLREQTSVISLYAGCGGLDVSNIVSADSKEAVSEYKKLSKSNNQKLWDENRDNLMAMNEVLMPVWQEWDLKRYYPQKIKRFDIEVNLNELPMIGRTELMRRIIQFFRNQGIPVGRSFTGDLEVWIPANRKNPWNGKLYDKFTIRPRFQDQSAGWELHITHAGIAKVSNVPMSALHNLPNKGFSVMVGTEVLSVSKMAPRHRKQQHNVYPIANIKLRNIIRLTPHYEYDKNKLVTKFNLIDKFAKTYLLTDDFKNAIGIDFPTGEWMDVHQEDKTLIPTDARFLEYADGNKGLYPMNDLPQYGPFRMPNNNVKFIMIFQKDDSRSQHKSAMKLLNGLTYGADTDEDIRFKEYDTDEIYQEKNRKQQNSAFRSMSRFIGQPFILPEGHAFIFNRLSTAVEEVKHQLNRLSNVMRPDYTYEAIYISPIKQDDANADALTVYYKLKEMLMERGIMLQTIYCQNPYARNFSMFIPNLSVAMLAKAGGIPFVLHKPYGDDDLIIGVGAYSNQKVGQRYVGSAICFDNKGMLQGYNCWPDIDTDRLKNSIKQGIIGFIRDHGHNPKRVIIHYYKTMSRKEARPITTMLYNLGLRGVPVFVLNINKTESEDLVAFDREEKNLMPESGTVVNLGKGNYLLYNNSKYSSDDNASVLYPVKIRISKVDQDGKSQGYSDEEALELLTQAYQFSRLSYKTVKQQNMPVTTLYPELAARIIPFFDGKCIPEAGRKQMGFL